MKGNDPKEWCSHISVDKDGYYFIYERRVPMSWEFCPECGERKP